MLVILSKLSSLFINYCVTFTTQKILLYKLSVDDAINQVLERTLELNDAIECYYFEAHNDTSPEKRGMTLMLAFQLTCHYALQNNKDSESEV